MTDTRLRFTVNNRCVLCSQWINTPHEAGCPIDDRSGYAISIGVDNLVTPDDCPSV